MFNPVVAGALDSSVRLHTRSAQGHIFITTKDTLVSYYCQSLMPNINFYIWTLEEEMDAILIGVSERNEFLSCLRSDELKQPPAEENVDGLNFVFLRHKASPLKNNIIIPYPMRNLTAQQKIYNYRVSRARCVVENEIGILANRFCVFHTAINLSKCREISNYIPSTSTDQEDVLTGTIQ